MQLPGRVHNDGGGGGVAYVQIAGSVFAAEVSGVEDIVACHHCAFVGIPVHGVGVGVVRVQAEAAAAVAIDLEHQRFISGVGAAEDLRNLLVVRS